MVGKTNKAGVTSWYWQPSKTLAAAGFTALTLGKDEGAAIAAARARNAEVGDWKAGGARPDSIQRRILSGTVGALITRYRRDVIAGKKPDGRPLIRPKTRTVYETSLKRLETWAGDQPLAFITPARVRALRDGAARPIERGGIGHAAAFNMLRQGRQLFKFAESIDLAPRGSNPFESFGLGAPPSRRTIWELEHDAAFDAAAYALGQPAMVLARELALYTAQREGDLISFTEAQLQELQLYDQTVRSHFSDPDGIVMGWQLDQAKTSTDYMAVQLSIPLELQLRGKVEAAIRANRARDRAAASPRLLTYVLVDPRSGLPWKQRAFIAAWRAVLEHAATHANRSEMRGLTWHDLRRTRVVRLRRRGMSPAMIASLTGHDPKSIDMMLRVYGPVDPQMTGAALAASLEPYREQLG